MYERYMTLPTGPLRSQIESSIVPLPERDQTQAGSPFAIIQMLPSGECPFLSPEHFCGIQLELGESYLSRICAVFPRAIHTIDGLKETALSLACPEAARLVLLDPQLLPPTRAHGYELTWDETKPVPLRAYFWQIRLFVVNLLQNRTYPLWQRLFLLGTFSRRVNVRGEAERRVPDVLDDFSRAIAAGGLCAQMEVIPADLPLQLEIVLELVAQRVNNIYLGPKLLQVLEEFAAGIGHSREASIEDQVKRYRHAYDKFYAPFFLRRPHILENYLLNLVLRDLFPFGEKLSNPKATPEPGRAFAHLVIQFALIKCLLIGVAGARGSRFSSADVIRTVYTAFRHFEHYPQFLSNAYELLEQRQLNDIRGLAMLLRN